MTREEFFSLMQEATLAACDASRTFTVDTLSTELSKRGFEPELVTQVVALFNEFVDRALAEGKIRKVAMPDGSVIVTARSIH